MSLATRMPVRAASTLRTRSPSVRQSSPPTTVKAAHTSTETLSSRRTTLRNTLNHEQETDTAEGVVAADEEAQSVIPPAKDFLEAVLPWSGEAFDRRLQPDYYSLRDIVNCVCGTSVDDSLETREMVLCDNCEQWQHVPCMQLDSEDLPEDYFCHNCLPELHQHLFTTQTMPSAANDVPAVQKNKERPVRQSPRKPSATIPHATISTRAPQAAPPTLVKIKLSAAHKPSQPRSQRLTKEQARLVQADDCELDADLQAIYDGVASQSGATQSSTPITDDTAVAESQKHTKRQRKSTEEELVEQTDHAPRKRQKTSSTPIVEIQTQGAQSQSTHQHALHAEYVETLKRADEQALAAIQKAKSPIAPALPALPAPPAAKPTALASALPVALSLGLQMPASLTNASPEEVQQWISAASQARRQANSEAVKIAAFIKARTKAPGEKYMIDGCDLNEPTEKALRRLTASEFRRALEIGDIAYRDMLQFAQDTFEYSNLAEVGSNGLRKPWAQLHAERRQAAIQRIWDEFQVTFEGKQYRQPATWLLYTAYKQSSTAHNRAVKQALPQTDETRRSSSRGTAYRSGQDEAEASASQTPTRGRPSRRAMQTSIASAQPSPSRSVEQSLSRSNEESASVTNGRRSGRVKKASARAVAAAAAEAAGSASGSSGSRASSVQGRSRSRPAHERPIEGGETQDVEMEDATLSPLNGAAAAAVQTRKPEEVSAASGPSPLTAADIPLVAMMDRPAELHPWHGFSSGLINTPKPSLSNPLSVAVTPRHPFPGQSYGKGSVGPSSALQQPKPPGQVPFKATKFSPAAVSSAGDATHRELQSVRQDQGNVRKKELSTTSAKAFYGRDTAL